jgi:hypothetical protein
LTEIEQTESPIILERQPVAAEGVVQVRVERRRRDRHRHSAEDASRTFQARIA